MKTLLFDIETAPSLGYYFDPAKEYNILDTVTPWYMLSFGWKWLEDKKVHVLALPDFKAFKKNKTDDRELVHELWKLFNDADILIAHHGDPFDIKKSNARFLQHGLKPPKPYLSIDTRKLARKYFKFDSNKLNELGKYLNLGRKIKHTGFDLWKDCMKGDLKAWKMMKKYNKQDVVLLEKIYLQMRGWMTIHPNKKISVKNTTICSNCGHKGLRKRGFGVNTRGKYQRYQCQECGAWSQGKI